MANLSNTQKGFIVEDEDYRIIYDGEGTQFDLELLRTINKGKANERSEFKIAAYGITIEKCLEEIINYRVTKKHPLFKGVRDLAMKQYFQAFFQEKVNLLENLDIPDEKWKKVTKLDRIKTN